MSKARKKPAKKKPTKAKAAKKPTKRATKKTAKKKAKKATKKKAAKKVAKKPVKKKAAKKATKKKVAKTKPKKATKKKAAKKAAKTKAKAKTKPAKKVTRKKVEEFDVLAVLVKSEDRRLGVKGGLIRSSVSVDKLDDFRDAITLRDSRLLQSVKHQIARRGEMIMRIQSFADRLKKSLGEQISISVRLNDYGEICLSTAFKPNKGQRSFDGDPDVANAFKTSGLFRLMGLDGTGTMMRGKNAGVRDHDFSEKKWEYVEPEAAVA